MASSMIARRWALLAAPLRLIPCSAAKASISALVSLAVGSAAGAELSAAPDSRPPAEARKTPG